MDRTFKPDSSGVIYIPKELIDKDAFFEFLINGKPATPEKYKLYHVAYYPKGQRDKIVYSKFHFPFTNKDIDDKIYYYNGRAYNEFEYLYFTKKIDKSKLNN